MKKLIIGIVLLALMLMPATAFADLTNPVGTINVGAQGFTNPESVLVDRANNRLYVSCQNAQAGATDGVIAYYDLTTYAYQGFFDCGGATLIDPMGMALIGNDLYVANSDLLFWLAGNIVRINVTTGACVGGAALWGPGDNYFDLVTDGTDLWASSDFELHRFTGLGGWPVGPTNSWWLDNFAGGNGIVLGAGTDVWVGDGSGTNPGVVQSYHRTTGAHGADWDFSPAGAASIDGLAWAGAAGASDLYATEWGTDVYVRYHATGTYAKIISGLTNAADIDIDTVAQRLYVADMGANLVRIYRQPSSSVQTATGTGTATFQSDKGVIEDLDDVGEGTLTCPVENKPKLDFLHGFFSFNITGLPAGETVVVTITLPEAVPVGTQYWKCHDGAWLDVTSLLGDDDGDNVLTLTLTDGGLGDDDGLPNGEIVEPGGPGQPRHFTLTVNKVGDGTVTSTPTGILCGGDCTEKYLEDTVVTLTAHPGVKSYFIDWSGDCAGTERTVQVTMDADKICTATFGYPVGGIIVPVNKLELLAPWMGLVALASLTALTVVLVRRRRG